MPWWGDGIMIVIVCVCVCVSVSLLLQFSTMVEKLTCKHNVTMSWKYCIEFSLVSNLWHDLITLIAVFSNQESSAENSPTVHCC